MKQGSLFWVIYKEGCPSAYDRILASRFGGKAVDLLKQTRDKMLGLINGELVTTDIEKVFSVTKPLDMELYELADILSF